MRDEHISAAMIVAFNPRTLSLTQTWIQRSDAQFYLGARVDLAKVIRLNLQPSKARGGSRAPDNLMLW